MATGDPGPTDAAVRLLYEEARHRAAAVTDAITEMEDRIEGTIRFNVLLLGLALTGVSFLLRFDGGMGPPPTLVLSLLALGTLALMASTAIAVTAYLKEKIAAGVDTDALYSALAYDLDQRELQMELLRVYRVAIAEDETVIDQTSRRFRGSLYGLLLGLGLFTLAALDLSVGGIT